MAEFTLNYTAEDIANIRKWFEVHSNEIPATLEIPATSFKDLPATIEGLLSIAQKHYANPVFAGQIKWLFVIKEALENPQV